jgi:pimeloyl-ACP methyl ester carboxylesterase
VSSTAWHARSPGALETMGNSMCTQMRGIHLVDGAGLWVQEEQPEEVNGLLVSFRDLLR